MDQPVTEDKHTEKVQDGDSMDRSERERGGGVKERNVKVTDGSL